MPQRESIWDHDLWENIYSINDIHIQLVCVRLYRLILDMHNKDLQAEQIARALKGERKLYLSIGQKIAATAIGLVTFADFIIHLVQ